MSPDEDEARESTMLRWLESAFWIAKVDGVLLGALTLATFTVLVATWASGVLLWSF